jgi:3-oxoadipate enol-lactonase
MTSKELNLIDQGTGPTVVLLHPIGLDATFWGRASAVLQSAFRVVSIDLAGHGQSPPAPSGHGLADYADDVARIVERFGPPVTVAGLSFGGMIAQALAIRHPTLVGRLVLCGCPCTFDASLRPVIAARGTAAEQGGMEAVAEPTLARWFTPAYLAAGGAELVRQRLLSDDVAGWATGWRAIAAHDTADALASVRVPTVCIAGEHDQSVPPAAVSALSARLPGSKFEVIPGGSHMMHIENAEAFGQAVLRFTQGSAER